MSNLKNGDLFTAGSGYLDADSHAKPYPAPPGLENPADRERVKGQRARVLALMGDGRWRTLNEISTECSCSEASTSARLRDFRKDEFGAWTVNRRLRFKEVRGLFEYQVGEGGPGAPDFEEVLP